MNEEWLNPFGSMTYGIYALTVKHEQALNAMIASWVSQVSYEPPLIMTAVHPNRYSHELIDQAGAFALHVLGRSQKEMLKRFKGPDPEKKFDGISWKTKQTGAPVLDDCIAWFELEVRQKLSPGNHTLFIAEVVNCSLNSSADPLTTLDYEGMYTGRN